MTDSVERKRKVKALPRELSLLTSDDGDKFELSLETDTNEKSPDYGKEVLTAQSVLLSSSAPLEDFALKKMTIDQLRRLDVDNVFDLNTLTIDQLRRLCMHLGITNVGSHNKFNCRKAIAAYFVKNKANGICGKKRGRPPSISHNTDADAAASLDDNSENSNTMIKVRYTEILSNDNDDINTLIVDDVDANNDGKKKKHSKRMKASSNNDDNNAFETKQTIHYQRSSLSCLCRVDALEEYKRKHPYYTKHQEYVHFNNQNDNNILSKLLYPLSYESFLSQCFRQVAVYVPDLKNTKAKKLQKQTRNGATKQDHHDPSQPNRFSPISNDNLYGLDPLQIFQNTSSDNIFVWMQQPHPTQQHAGINGSSQQTKSSSTTTVINSIEINDPMTAYALHTVGKHSTYCRASPDIEQYIVQQLLRDTGMGCGQYDPAGGTSCLGRGEVELFMSTTVGHITNWHTDFQENFTFQLSGVKRWYLRRGTVTHPIRGCTPHYASPEIVESQLLAARLSNPTFQFEYPTNDTTTNTTNIPNGNTSDAFECVTLYPGDFFYFPAGMWHKIEVMEPGVSMNVSLMATNYASVTCSAIQHLLLQKDEWRQCIVDNKYTSSNASTGENSSSTAVQHLKRLLKELPSIIMQFELNGGADAILPPSMRLQQQQQQSSKSSKNSGNTVGGNEEEALLSPQDGENENHTIDVQKDNIGSGDGGSGDDHEVEADDDQSMNQEEDTDLVLNDDDTSNDDDDDDNDEEESDENDTVLDVASYQLPESHSNLINCDPHNQNRIIIKNPLATLLSEEEVTSFYGNKIGGNHNNRNDDDCCCYILNVNYAGNEMHESLVRVCFKVNRNVMNDVLQNRIISREQQQKPQGKSLTKSEVVSSSSSDRQEQDQLINFLIYHGYLLLLS